MSIAPTVSADSDSCVTYLAIVSCLRARIALKTSVLVIAFALSLPSVWSAPNQSTATDVSLSASSAATDAATASRLTAEGSNLPRWFEANAGQTHPEVRYLSRGPEATVYLTGTEAVFALHTDTQSEDVSVVRMRFVGARAPVRVTGEAALPGKVNYFIGRTDWQTGVPTYGVVRYESLYPGVDVVFRSHPSELEYDVEIAPGASLESVRIAFEGIESLGLDESGNLELRTPGGALRQLKPVVYQLSAEGREPIEGRFRLLGAHQVGFEVSAYDEGRPLIIDPVLDFSSYLGGRRTDEAQAVAVDELGDAYVVGHTKSNDFPVEGAIQSEREGSTDVFITKYSADGGALLYTTYLGGSHSERGSAVAVTVEGEVVVAGYTDSGDFPTVMAVQEFSGKKDVFVSKLSTDGGELLYSTYLGGEEDDRASGIAMDEADNIFVVGHTRSASVPFVARVDSNGSDDDSDSDNDSDMQALVVKLDASGAIGFSVLMGGKKDDEATGVAVDATGDPVVVGFTQSRDFPTKSAFQARYGGGARDAFVARLDGISGDLVYSSYLGGNREDRAHGVAIDPLGSPVIVGSTKSKRNFPLANASQAAIGGNTDAFLSKLSPDGATLEYSSYLGGKKRDKAHAVATDGNGDIHIAGVTKSSRNFPVRNAVQPAYGGGNKDAFVARFGGQPLVLKDSSYLGGSRADEAFGIAADAEDGVWVVGATKSKVDFPLVNALQPGYAGGARDAFVVRLICPDTDGDGLTDCEEEATGTHPNLADTDGDGFSDAEEIAAGTDPLDASSTPRGPNQAPSISSAAITVATVGVPYSYDVDATDADLDTLTFSLMVAPAGMTIDSSSGLISFTPTAEGDFAVTVKVEDPLNAFATQSYSLSVAPAGNRPPVLGPVGNQSVSLGSTLTIDLKASDPNGDPLTFMASPLPLPAGANLMAATGAFTFTPDEAQVGTVDLTFIASDGSLIDSEAITITVDGPQPGAVTEVTGRVLDTNDFVLGTVTPIVGVTVSILDSGISTTTNSNGDFTLSDAAGVPAGNQILDFDSTTANPAPDSSAYSGFRESFAIIADVANVIDRPIFLPRIDADSLTTVDPNQTTIVTNPNINVTLTIPPHTAKDASGNDFTGALSISEVPLALAPAPLPDTLEPALLVTIQPVGVTFATPVPITFPNLDSLEPGTQVDIWSLDPNTGAFAVVGTGRVNATGTLIETISGGVVAADWHLPLMLAPVLAGVDPESSSNQNKSQDPDKASDECVGSSACISAGDLTMAHRLAPYRSLDTTRSLRFVYSSERAHPQPSIVVNPSVDTLSSLPESTSTELAVGGVEEGVELFTSNAGLTTGVRFRQSVQFDASELPTGLYPYQLRVSYNFPLSTVSTLIGDTALVHNHKRSPFGAGWSLDGLQHLEPFGNSGMLVTNGNGAAQLFTDSVLVEVANYRNSGGSASKPSARTLILEDFNNDGFKDALYQGGVLPGSSPNQLKIRLGDGAGGLLRDLKGVNMQGIYGGTHAVADFDEDGNLDVIVSGRDAAGQLGMTLYFGSGNGGFTETPIIPTDRAPGSYAIGDFNGDNHIDVAVDTTLLQEPFGGGFAVYLGDGSGALVPSFTSSIGANPIITDDVNGDGHLDLIMRAQVATGTTDVSVLLGDGAGAFAEVEVLDEGETPIRLATGDFNGDGDVDLVALATTNLRIFLGEGDGRFSLETLIGGNDATDMSVADFNQDGVSDILLTGGNKITIFPGNGAGGVFPGVPITFDLGISFDFPGGTVRDSTVGDLNNDGVPDIGIIDRAPGGIADLIGTAVLADTPGFAAPPGEFSAIVQNADDSFTRTNKDGTRIEFNSGGRHTQTVDRNGNVTEFFYSGDKLETIRDPMNLDTTFVYSGGLLQSVTLPDGRITQFEHDSSSNLTKIIDPDTTERVFMYDPNNLVVLQRSKRGFDTLYEYDFAGRFKRSIRPDGSTRQLISSETIALIDVESGLGTKTNPAPLVFPDDEVATYTDGTGDAGTRMVDRFGALTQSTDAVGLTIAIDRDEDGLPTRVETPDGAVSTFVNDDMGNVRRETDEVKNGTRKFTYDANFNLLTSVEDSLAKTTLFLRNAANGNLEGIQTPLGRTVSMTHDGRGRVDTLTDEFGSLTDFDYHATNGNLERITENPGADERVTVITQTPEGYVDIVTDAENRVFNFDYDAMGRITKQTLPDLRVIDLRYDASGNVEGITPPGRPEHTFGYSQVNLESSYSPPDIGLPVNNTVNGYDADQQLKQIDRPDGLTVKFDYDAANRLNSVSLPSRGATPIGLTYNATTGNLKTLTTPEGDTLTFAYNADLLTSSTWGGAVTGQVSQTYDTERRVDSQSVNGSQTVTFQFDDDGLLKDAGLLNLSRDPQHGRVIATTLDTVTTSRDYTAVGELETQTAEVSTTTIYDVALIRDDLGRIKRKTEIIEGGVPMVTDYTYDPAGRLDTVTIDRVPTSDYDYDDNGNRTGGFNDEGTISGVYDAQDRLTDYNGVTYTYSANGELESKTEGIDTTQYQYDEMGNLLSVMLPDTTAIEYVVDGQNRRIGKKVAGALVQGFLYQDQLNPVAELDSQGNVTSRFIYADKPNVPAYMETGDVTYRIISDHLGSVRLVVDTATGVVMQRIDYDEFGIATLDTNPGFQPFGFAGGLVDLDTGLVRFGARDYDPEIGRWTAKDPIRFVGGNSNVFLYIGSDPINFVDPTGLICIDDPTLRSLISGALGGLVTGAIAGGVVGGVATGPVGVAGAPVGAILGGLSGAFVGAAVGALSADASTSAQAGLIGAVSADGTPKGITAGVMGGLLGTLIPPGNPIAQAGAAGFIGGGLAAGPLGAFAGGAGGLTTGAVDELIQCECDSKE